MRSDTAFFSAADISRRFLAGLASDLLSAAATAFVVGEEERRDVERAVGADAPRICSTSVNALISAWKRSISLWRLAIADCLCDLTHGGYRQHSCRNTLQGLSSSPRVPPSRPPVAGDRRRREWKATHSTGRPARQHRLAPAASASGGPPAATALAIAIFRPVEVVNTIRLSSLVHWGYSAAR